MGAMKLKLTSLWPFAKAPAEPPPQSELHRRIRRLEIRTLRLVHTVFGGEYQSVFKGRGIEFDEVREYQEGDDPRLIDWNVTARMDRLFVKKFIEERELSILLVVDVSASHAFGSTVRLKRELAAELAAALAMSALYNHDQVGLLMFSDRVEKFIAPRKGRGHVNRMVRDILTIAPAGRATDYQVAVDFVRRVVKQRCVMFFLSDFLTPNYERPLRLAGTRHDVIPVLLSDPREFELPDVGLVRVEDPETGEMLIVDTHAAHVREEYARSAQALRSEQVSTFRSLGLDFLPLSTDQGYVKPLIKFFESRQARRAKGKGLV